MSVSRISLRYPNLNALGKLLHKRGEAVYRRNFNKVNKDRRVTAMRDDFLSVASHELKTPLTSLKLQVQLIQRLSQKQNLEPVPPEKFQVLAENADRQITRMTLLINSLLEASRLRAGRLELKPEAVDLTAVVRAEVERFRGMPAYSHLDIRVMAKRPVVGTWDRARIELILQGLLSNAVQFGLDKPIQIRVASLRGTARVTVRDYGMGISAQDHDRIFDFFERGVPAAHFGGLGLGLYIANQIAIAHEGTLQVRSKLGEGSVFTLELPMNVQPAFGRVSA